MQDINEIMKIRRESLLNSKTQADPFHIVKCDVTHRTADIVSQFENLKERGFRLPAV